jgi:hypothetical protein
VGFGADLWSRSGRGRRPLADFGANQTIAACFGHGYDLHLGGPFHRSETVEKPGYDHVEDADAAIGRLLRGATGARHSCYELDGPQTADLQI